MEKYLEKLLLQIRCKKARPYIAEEIKGHIESQIEDNIADGMSYEEARRKHKDVSPKEGSPGRDFPGVGYTQRQKMMKGN